MTDIEPPQTEQPEQPVQPSPTNSIKPTSTRKSKKQTPQPTDDPNISPMKASILTQTSRIEEIISNASLFRENYSELTTNIIASINQQIRSYVKNSKRSILIDIYELVIDSIDWNDLQAKLANRLKSKQPSADPPAWKPLPKPSTSIELFDDDAVTNMLLNCDTEHVKDFSKYRKLCRSQIADLLSDIDAFEAELCEYRTSAVKLMVENVSILFDYHYNYVSDMFYKHKASPSVIINNQEIQLKKSQKEFITSALKQLICRQK